MTSQQPYKPIIGITMGDVAGIGPEVIVKALSLQRIYKLCCPIVIGDARIIEAATQFVEIEVKIHAVNTVNDCVFRYGIIDVFDLNNVNLSEISIGRVNKLAGKAAVDYVMTAIDLALNNKIHAIATAPLNKEAINLAGYHFQGHTEILAKVTNTQKYAMMLAAGPLRVIHVTTHVSLREACEKINKVHVLNTIMLAHKSLMMLGFDNPKIVVSGLNPHAGEGGLFGTEEIDHILPAIQEAQRQGVNVQGPLPPDTVFLKAIKGHFDIVVAMYHDQGHIPIKLMGFEKGVNVTMGLPIIRTSVDHGTAFDIAGQGVANPESMIEAIIMAVNLARNILE